MTPITDSEINAQWHTPGPWHVSLHAGTSANGAAIVAEDGFTVATLPRKADRHYERKQADAHLIAAAPDLYAALKRARRGVYAIAESSHLLEGFGPRKRTQADDDLAELDAALAKAEGRASTQGAT